MPSSPTMADRKLAVKWNKTTLDIDVTPEQTVEEFKGVICSLTNVRRNYNVEIEIPY
jgi:hypothetical protein